MTHHQMYHEHHELRSGLVGVLQYEIYEAMADLVRRGFHPWLTHSYVHCRSMACRLIRSWKLFSRELHHHCDPYMGFLLLCCVSLLESMHACTPKSQIVEKLPSWLIIIDEDLFLKLDAIGTSVFTIRGFVLGMFCCSSGLRDYQKTERLLANWESSL